MYSDDDPYLTELRDVCLAFPESCEVEAWGRPTFRAGKKMSPSSPVLRSGPGASSSSPSRTSARRCSRTGATTCPRTSVPGGWLALDFAARKPVDWAEVAELIDSSYRQVALKRMLKALEERG